MKVTDEQIEFIIERLKEGKPLPEEFKWLLFEGKQEAELGYFGKERDINIITETMAVPLQRVKSFGEIKINIYQINFNKKKELETVKNGK